ncbi:hypothetical protein [Desulfonatronovibrio hydrogenovorans]|uniref:hypothetical protein n=1 Tax=Desulfonatronovibrio hydrogenovorans TaxID=53245 RepID=UPI000689B2DA|nr:hypothetical protein [Desulfonatronovibrio hydrogenovorans]
MKINPDQISQIARENGNVQKKTSPSGEFGKMLEQEISRGQTQDKTASGPARLDILQTSQLLGSSLITSQNRESSFMNQMDSLLNKWENYAAGMDSPSSSLKEVYANLESISRQIKEMKNSSSFDNQSPEVKSMIQELEVMATTEVIKFNRGDYLT